MPRRKAGPRLYLDRKRGQWVIRDGARFVRTGCLERDGADAEKALALYLGNKYQPKISSEPLIADILLAYSTDILAHSRAPGNAAYNVASLADWWGAMKVSEVTPGHCRAYATTKTPSAARRDLEVFRAAINYWHKHKKPLPSVPGVILPNKPEPRQWWLTREEARRLRHAAMRVPHLYRFIVIGLLTGSRSAAILSLTWDRINFDQRLMHRRGFNESEAATKKSPPVRMGTRLTRLLIRWRKQDGPKAVHVIHYKGQPVTRIKAAMTRPLGKHQLRRLMGLASPGCMLVVAHDAVSKSLVKRGLTAPKLPDEPDAWHGITPNGLRALADAFETGKLQQFMKPFPPERKADNANH